MAFDTVLGKWRVSVQLPEAIPPHRYWGETIEDALSAWAEVRADAARIRATDGWPTLETAVRGQRQPIVVTIEPTDWDDAR